MNEKSFLLWVALPPAAADVSMLLDCRGLAEPLVDLRFGSAACKRSTLLEATRAQLPGLTVVLELSDAELVETARRSLPPGSRVIFATPRIDDAVAGPVASDFKAGGVVVGFEVDSVHGARAALEGGADFLAASGNEAAGPVSSKTSLILIQELSGSVGLPLVVRGSVGPAGAAAMFAAGCAGCILDSQLLLLPESPLGERWRTALSRASPFDTRLIGALVGRSYRVLAPAGTRELEELLERERAIFLGDSAWEEKGRALDAMLRPLAERGLSDEAALPPVGQGVTFARDFAERGLRLREVIAEYRDGVSQRVARLKRAFPFQRGSTLSRLHGVDLPIVQGPMAAVSTSSRFAANVAQGGALPFIAAAGLTEDGLREAAAQTRAALNGGKFGLGLIAFMSEEAGYAAQVLAARPDFVTVAGGGIGHARMFEDAGIPCYLHAPSPAHVQQFLDGGVRGLILEGHEAGGHVGSLGSLILWEVGAAAILKRDAEHLSGLRVLFAGGIATAASSLAAAVIAAPLQERGVACGLQVGTAYLATQESVASGAISTSYQKALLQCGDTIVSGGSVNLPARWALTFAAWRLIADELALAAQGKPLAVRKQLVEALNREHLQAAATGEGLGRGEGQAAREPAYMCGQVISVLATDLTIATLHRDLTEGAALMAGQIAQPAETGDGLRDAVAIIGMGCMFPGANNPAEYWRNVTNRVSAVEPVPKDRWDTDVFYDPSGELADKSMSQLGAFVKGFQKDPAKFRIPPVAAASIDRVQFMALEVAQQTFADAGYLHRDFPRDRTGVILGNSMGGELTSDYTLRILSPLCKVALEKLPEFRELPGDLRSRIASGMQRHLTESTPEFTEDSCPGSLGSLIAGRICNYFGLRGVGFTLDGACASSLAAVDAGISGLRSGQFDMVLAGGADTRMDAGAYVLFSSLGVLSDKGCFPFDERADGFVMGEGVGMVLLKRLADAVRDGDRVYAVIRGVGSSSDGLAKSVTAPDVQGQVTAMLRAYDDLTFSPATVALVEAHGTATQAGDLTELTSLNQVFGRYGRRSGSVAIGSVKSMIGHLKTAAGVAGLIKAALALHHRVLPPAINCEQPRRDFDWDASPFYLIAEPRPWEDEGHQRRAAVNAFGFGGVNYHVVLEEAPPGPPTAGVRPSGEAGPPVELFVFRAPTRSQVLEQLSRAQQRLSDGGALQMRSIAAELLQSCPSGGATLAVVAADAQMLDKNITKARELLRDTTRGQCALAQGIYYGEADAGVGKVAFLFPGQGSQYVNMGGDLLRCFPFLRSTLDAVDRVAQRWTGRHVLAAVFADGDLDAEQMRRLQEEMERTDYNHPALLAAWAATLAFLRRAGIRPDMAAGHSVGEYGALYAAGVLDLEAVVAVTTARGAQVYEHAFRRGAMVAVGAPADLVEQELARAHLQVTIANRNCPAQTVISGDAEAVGRAQAELQKMGVRCTLIAAASGFHSPLMSSCVKPFREVLERVPLRPPAIPVQCNLTGRAYETDGQTASRMRDALAQHLMSPVDFIGNVESMYADGARLFLEVGPGSALCSFTDNILTERPHWAFPTNLSRVTPATQLVHALAFCVARGLSVDLAAVLPYVPQRLTSAPRLPTLRVHNAPAVLRKPQPGDWVSHVLSDSDPKAAERYAEARAGFLEEMVRLDYAHFAAAQAAMASPESVGPGDAIESRIVEVVSRMVGYPPEVLGLDLDVEAELGLDSIKQAEILRELESMFGVSVFGGVQKAGLHITTLRAVAARFRELTATRPQEDARPQAKPGQPVPRDTGQRWNLDCHRFVCELRERALSAPGAAGELRGQQILLLADALGVADALTVCLEQAGAAVHRVHAGTKHLVLPDATDVVLDLWSYGEDQVPDLEACDRWWEQLSSRAVALLQIARGFVACARGRARHRGLWVEVTSLGGDLGARSMKSVPSLAGAGLGVSRCLFADHPDLLDVLYVDLGPGEAAEDVAQRLMGELAAPRVHNEIGYVGGKRFEIHWRMEAGRPPSREPPLAPGSVVVAAGGGRGIAASICRELAQHAELHFVIVGTTPLRENTGEALTLESARRMLLEERRVAGREVILAEVERQAWERLRAQERADNMAALRRVAKSAVYRQCDLTDSRATGDLVRHVMRDYGRIDLVVNGAGGLVERTIEEFEPEPFVSGFRPKALATANLLAALKDVRVGAFVNLSSVVGRWGYMGLASYAVGHATASILTAGMRGARCGKWLDMLYGPWLGVGMTRLGSTTERLRQSGGAFVGEQEGCRYFLDELARGSQETTAFRGTESFGILSAGPDRGRPRPLLDKSSVVGPGMAEGSVVLDPSRHPFVEEHVVELGPIVPGAVAMEIMAQTASVLAPPQLTVTDFADVEFVRPISFPRGEPREVLARAREVSRQADEAWFALEVFTVLRLPGSTEPEEVRHAAARLRFGVRQSPCQPSLVAADTGLGDCQMDMQEFWRIPAATGRKGMFRNVTSIRSLAPDSVCGEVLARPGLNGSSALTDNPIRLDGLFYLPSLPGVVFHGGMCHYLTGIKSLTLFESHDPGGMRLARSLVRERKDWDIISDVESLDASGNVTERVLGVLLVRAGTWEREQCDAPIMDRLRWNPQQTEVARLLGLHCRLSLAEVRASVVEAALKARGEEACLAEWLGPEEREAYAAMQHPKRRREWLAGRVAAKQAVRSLLGVQAPAPPAVRVVGSAHAAPKVLMDAEGSLDSMCISIAHSDDCACAAAACGASIGIDVQRVALEVGGFPGAFCKQEEADRVGRSTGDQRVAVLMAIWTAKEASLKALSPEQLAMTDLSVESARLEGPYAIFEIGLRQAITVRAVVFRSHEYYYAVAARIEGSPARETPAVTDERIEPA